MRTFFYLYYAYLYLLLNAHCIFMGSLFCSLTVIFAIYLFCEHILSYSSNDSKLFRLRNVADLVFGYVIDIVALISFAQIKDYL